MLGLLVKERAAGMRPRYLLAIAMIAAAPVALSAQTADAIYAHAVSAYASVKTVKATFEQALTSPITGVTSLSHGDFVQERPNHLSIRFTDPADEQHDRIVADGSWVWMYTPSATPGQVIKMPVGQGAKAATVDVIGEFLTGPRDRFEVSNLGTDTVQTKHTHEIQLVPKNADVQFTKAKLWVDDGDGAVRQFEVTDGNGTVRRVRLTTLAFNTPVDRGAFSFSPPSGVKVVDHDTMAGGAD